MQYKSKSSQRDPKKDLVGRAIHALRAYAKAYEMKAGEGAEYSYRVADDGKSAAILDSQGAEVDSRPIEKWAAEGPRVRQAFIGLKAIKECFEDMSRAAGERPNVRFRLDVFEGSATLTLGTDVLTQGDLNQVVQHLNVPDAVKAVVPQLTDADLVGIAGWSKIGREIELDFFHALQAAEQYELAEDVTRLRERGYRLGVIRRPREAGNGGPDASQAA